MFKQEYQLANDRIHAGDALLDRIRAGQVRQKALTRTVWWSAGGTLAAAAAVLAVLFAVPLTKSASPTADAAAPAMDNGYALAGGGAESDGLYLEAEESAMDMAVSQEAPAEEPESAPVAEARFGMPGWPYEDSNRSCAMDDWFVILREDGGAILAAAEEDGKWRVADGLTLALPAQSLLTDDDSLYAVSVLDGETAVTQYGLTDGAAVSLRQNSMFTQPGAYLDALLENDVLYLLTQTDDALCLGAADMSGNAGRQAEWTLPVHPESASLFESADGVLLACQTGDSCRLYMLRNGAEGLRVHAEGEQTGALQYAYRTRNGNWHTVFSLAGTLVERILDDAFAAVSEQAMALYAEEVYCDDEELLVCTYPDQDNVMQVERYAVQTSGFYASTGEVWRMDGGGLGNIVSWDDDDGVLYLLSDDGLYAFSVRAGTAARVADFS